MWIIAGLGNPESEYEGTRHNVGRECVMLFAKKHGTEEWKEDKKLKALAAKGEVGGVKVQYVLPNAYMNNSGVSLKPLVLTAKAAKQLAIVHDDLDLPLGTVKFSFGSGAAGHKGVESVQKQLKTHDFVRVRIGISPSTPKGKLKRPDGEKIVDFVLGTFRAPEQEKLKKARALTMKALELLLTEGLEKARMEIHTAR